MQVRTRFAPSPTGYMHVGNLRTALYTFLIARHFGGTFILRIEDTDQERFVEGAVDVIYRTMRTVGLEYDEGPDVGGSYGPYIQSQRREIYLSHAEKLISERKAYRCFCTKERLDAVRKEQVARNETAMYDGHCKHLSQDEINRRMAAGEPNVIRQVLPKEGTITVHCLVYGDIEVQNSMLDEGVLIKSDGLPTYNFANVVDDHLMQISHVVRGNEYLSSVAKFDHLYNAFGWQIPNYIHLPHIMKDASRKLSKRDGDASFEDFYNKGFLKEAIVNYVALLGWNPGNDEEIFTLEEMKQKFSLEGLSKHAAIFDPVKLRWMNSVYVRKLPFEEFHTMTKPYYAALTKVSEAGLRRLSEVIQCRVEVFSEVPKMVGFLAQVPDYDVGIYVNKKMKTDLDNAREHLGQIIGVLEALPEWAHDPIKEAINKYCESRTIKPALVFWPFRIALSGQESTPGGALEIAEILGREESLCRIHAAVNKLSQQK